MAFRKLPPSEGGLLRLYRKYRKDAKRRGHAFDLDLDTFHDVVIRPCFFCRVARTQVSSSGHGRFTFTGVDRLDSAKGYEPRNVVACCGRCNRAKGILSAADFIELCRVVAQEVG